MDIKTRHFLKWSASKIRKHLPLMFIASLVVSMLTLYSTRQKPQIYSATTSVIYGTGSSSSLFSPGMMSGMGLATLASSGGGGGNISGLLIKEILQSRSMSKDVIEQFDLVKRFNAPNDYLAYLKLKKLIKIINYDMKSIIVLTVKYPDPQMSADIANFYISNLIRMNNKLKLSTERDIVEILDRAEKPIYSIGPNVAKNTFMSFIGTFIFLFIVILIITMIQRQFQRDSGPEL